VESLDPIALYVIGLVAVLIAVLALLNPMSGWGRSRHEDKRDDSPERTGSAGGKRRAARPPGVI
jgi:hypothetical protein